MKKQEENQPIDDLFARKLGNASLSPSLDAFERLQARMNKTEPRVILWRNPTIQRYMAIAACLLLVCLFGWLYLQADSEPIKKGEQVANSFIKPQKSSANQPDSLSEENLPDKKTDTQQVQVGGENNLATLEEPAKVIQKKRSSVAVSAGQSYERNSIISAKTEKEQPVLAQIPRQVSERSIADTTLPVQKTTNLVNTNNERVAGSNVKTAAHTERVLTVTIEEPSAMVAARQVARTGATSVVVLDEKPEKEAKGNLWQQVKRIKEGDVFARRDNPNNDDKGLLGRAYSGLKQSFEKDKSEK